MPSSQRKFSANLFLLCFTISSNFVLATGEMVHARNLAAFTGVSVIDQTENWRLAYEQCITEIRKQAVTIQRLEEITGTQANTIKELQEMAKQQQNAIRFIGEILKNPNLTGSSFTEYFSAKTGENQPLNVDRNKNVFKSCDEIKSLQSPLPSSGTYWIDPDGKGGDSPIEVVCNMTSGATIISHDSEERIEVKPYCQSPGCFKQSVRYRNITFKQVIALTRLSSVCEQKILLDPCTEKSLKKKWTDNLAANVSWWKNRNGVSNNFWTGNKKDNIEGFLITNLDDLPVIELNFGPEYDAQRLCSTQFKLGKLVCTGKRSHDSSSSNKDSYGEVARRGSSGSRRPSRYRGKSKNRNSSEITGTDGSNFDSNSAFQEGCTIDLHASAPQYPPHLIDENNNIIQPVLHGKTRIITLNVDEKISIGCLGKNNSNVLKITGRPVNEAHCKTNSTLLVNQTELTYSQLGCTNQNKEILKEIEGVDCAKNGRGTLVRVGWQLNFDFIPLYEMCHDKVTTVNYFSTHVIVGRSVDADDKANTRPSFRQAGYYPGLDVNAALGPTQQNKTIAKTVGSEILAVKYFNQKKNFFLARGHLAPDGDFIDAASQDASYYYLNMAPQWQSFNGGNWNLLETAVREIAITRDLDLTIYTGTFGTMTLLDVNGINRPLYLATDKNNNGLIPVPLYFWKVIYDPISDTATAVIGINNPHLDRISPGDFICQNVCHQIPWIKWKITDISKGFMFCCTVQSLHKVISYAPNLDVPLFL